MLAQSPRTPSPPPTEVGSGSSAGQGSTIPQARRLDDLDEAEPDEEVAVPDQARTLEEVEEEEAEEDDMFDEPSVDEVVAAEAHLAGVPLDESKLDESTEKEEVDEEEADKADDEEGTDEIETPPRRGVLSFFS